MRNLDLISKRIAVIGIVLCCAILSVSVLMFSVANIKKSQASENVIIPQTNNGTGSVGEYMMAPVVFNDGTFVVLVWNTVTGKSQRYYLDTSTNPYTYVKNKVNLPENPLD